LHLLADTLRTMQNQTASNVVYVWNNNYSERAFVDEVCSRYSATVHHSKENIGASGKWHLAKEFDDFCILIDDDVNFSDTAIETFVQEYKPRRAFTFMGFQFPKDDYWDGRVVCRPGQEAHYACGGGLIIDASIFHDDLLWDFPEQFRFFDDFWLTYVGWRRGIRFFRSAVEYSMAREAADKNALWSKTRNMKSDIYRWMRDHGWRDERIPLL